jgi:hypothetical protein
METIVTKKHQNLTDLIRLTNEFLVSMTNQAYGRGIKFGYRVAWEKGKNTIQVEGHKTKNYYIFKFYIIDKTESPVGVEVDLYVNFYPVVSLVPVNKLEESAYKDFLLNGIQSLFNVTYALVMKEKNKEYTRVSDVEINDIVEQLKEDAKTPKIII